MADFVSYKVLSSSLLMFIFLLLKGDLVVSHNKKDKPLTSQECNYGGEQIHPNICFPTSFISLSWFFGKTNNLAYETL